MSGLSVALLIIALLGSAAVWVQIVLRLRRGEELLPRREQTTLPVSPLAKVLGVVIVVYMVGSQFLIETQSDIEQPPNFTLEIAQAVCLQKLIMAVILVAALTEFGTLVVSGTPLDWRSWKDDLKVGGLGFLASLLPVFAVQGILIGLNLRGEEDTHTFFQILQDNPGVATLAWIALAAVVLAPMTEELIFRVILQPTLAEVMPIRVAITLTALSFACVHGWPDLLPLLPLALILGYVMSRRGSFWAVLALHLLFNLFNLALYLASPNSP